MNVAANTKHLSPIPPLGGGGATLCILGAAESGIGAALLAKQHGYNVFVSDGGKIKDKYRQELIDNNIEFEEGHHTEEKILSADEIVKSPGIPEKNELIKKIRAKGIPVISEVELAYRYKGNSKIIAITGSNGKSTTTSFIYHICKTAGLDCALVGNIGYSFAKQIAEDPKPLYVAEISSFQLDDIKDFRPDVSLLLNITEDHLDRYDYKFENYINSKFRIIENQKEGDYFIYCADDKVITDKLKNIITNTIQLPFTMNHEIQQGAQILSGIMTLKVNEERIEMNVTDFILKGDHNKYNTMAASLAAAAVDIRKSSIREALQTYDGLEHRLEYVVTIRGVDYINDSKATNINSTWNALGAMERPVVLILGGVDKGNDYEILRDLVEEKVKAIVCMGKDNEKIIDFFKDMVPVTDTHSLEDAVKACYQYAQKGDVVLLSPACASFDLFSNFEDRGEQFKKAVKEL